MDDLKWSNWRVEHYKSMPCEQEFTAAVTTIAFKSGKESNLIVGLENGSLLLFDCSRDKPGFNLKRTISDHKAPLTAIYFTEKYLITSDETAIIRIYDLDLQKLAYSFQEEHSIENLETDGKILLTGTSSGTKIKLWNMNGYMSINTFNIQPCERISTKINKEGTLLLLAYSNGLIEVWNLQNACKITSSNIKCDNTALKINKLSIIEDANDSIHFSVTSCTGLIAEWRFEKNELRLVKLHNNLPSSHCMWINYRQSIAYCSDNCGNISAYDLNSYEKLYDLKPKLNEPIVHMEGDDNYLIAISSSHQMMMFDFLNVEKLFPLERQLLVELRLKEQNERRRGMNMNGESKKEIITKQRVEGDQIRRQELLNRKTRTNPETNNINNRSEVIVHNNIRQDEPTDKRPKSRLKPKENGSAEHSTQNDSSTDDDMPGLIPTLLSVGFFVLGLASFVMLKFVIKEQ